MQTYDSPPSKQQWAILAVLRFFLALTVVLGHFSLFIRLDTYRIFGDGYLNPGSAVFGFFIISGFSIAASVSRETEGFYGRRVLRIWPLYLATIAFGLALALWMPSGFTLPSGDRIPPTTTITAISSLLMLQTIAAGPLPMAGPIWSLSAEWWHYMIAPLLGKVKNVALLAWIALSFVAFMKISPPPGRGIDAMSHGLPFLVLSWLWITGFLYYRMRGSAFGFLMLALPSTFALTLGRFTGAPLFITIFVLIASTEIRVPDRLLRPCNFLGDYSYALYLLHIPSFVIALALGANRSIIQLGAAFVISLAAMYLIDYPARRIFKRRRSTPALAI